MINFSVDTVAGWFNYIRENPDDKRFLECFWDTQLTSKERLLDLYPDHFNRTCYVFGGWYGVLPKMLVDNKFIVKVYSVDIDPECERVGNVYFCDNDLEFITSDMADFLYKEEPDVVINTSTEHVDQDTFDSWWMNIPTGTFVMLQGNDLVIPEHVRPFKDLFDFVERNNMSQVLHSEEMELAGPNNTTYKRFTLTGYKE